MQQLIVEGGVPLHGEMRPGGNKNAALKMIPACLLTDEPVTLHNVPDILDVRVMNEIIRSLGADVTWVADRTLRIHARNLTTTTIEAQLASRLRASIVVAGPLLARAGRVELPLPGGDAIGERRLDMHVLALRKLGASIQYDGSKFIMEAERLKGTDILLTEASVTATENAIMAAVLAEGRTVIRNAASEPHVQDLCLLLNALGAHIEGVGSNR
ncbi:MAG: UDP-N-acetylglucosamine 1-carboxyvinyltransferase, partial [Anaerolinea sp.]|nr:UDP-N-acetylglucosamine 1-carboxyvinyltransferase [Anaerolinea sp.]